MEMGIRNLDPLFWKKGEVKDKKGKNLKIVEGKSSVLYSKLIFSEKHSKMITLFYTKNKTKKKIVLIA